MKVQPTHVRSGYVLGYSDAEQDRMIRQGMLLAPITERLFRDAGIGPGQRVLDIGSGIGDVAMIAARLVGPSGEVVGVEQNAGFLARARERICAVGFRNVTFIQADANALAIDRSFDAVVGRSVLNHNPDPVAMLRSVARPVIPGGVVAFQEIALSPALAVAARVPLWSRLLTGTHEIFSRLGMNPETGLALHQMFQEAGLPAPRMHLEMPLAGDSSIVQLEVDVLRTLRFAADQHDGSLAELGDLDSLVDRIHAEAGAAHSVTGFLAIVSASSRKNG
jgi:ubiquinone/menaquinone biosynthesis C-methylase UbiE